MTISGDSKLLAAGSFEGEVVLWDLDTGAVRHRIAAHDGDVVSVCLSKDGRVLATACAGAIQLWNATDGQLLTETRLHRNVNVALFPDGKRLAAAGTDLSVRIYAIPEGDDGGP